jgi:hypothetical protein
MGRMRFEGRFQCWPLNERVEPAPISERYLYLTA